MSTNKESTTLAPGYPFKTLAATMRSNSFQRNLRLNKAYFSSASIGRLMANTCSHCNAFIGQHYLWEYLASAKYGDYSYTLIEINDDTIDNRISLHKKHNYLDVTTKV